MIYEHFYSELSFYLSFPIYLQSCFMNYLLSSDKTIFLENFHV